LPLVRRSGDLLLLLGVVLLLFIVLLLLHSLTFHVFWHLGDHAAHLLISHHLEVSVLESLDLAVDSFNLEFVGMYLTLVVLKFGNHLLELLGAFLQILLVDDEFLSYFGATLLG
jgi:hypothetical protein